MSEVYVVAAEKRSEHGKSASKKYRYDGLIPAVFYRKGDEPLSLLVKEKDLEQLLIKRPAIFEVAVEGEENRECVLREVQRHPVTQIPYHIDMMGFLRGQKMNSVVAVRLVGIPEGVRLGGLLQQPMMEVEISCLPKDIPEAIEVNVEELLIGDSIHLIDLEFEGIEWLTLTTRTVASVMMPKVVAEPTTEEDEEIEGEEGEAVEGEEGSEESSDEE